nr:MAG TPA_asm: hypothetical protein [Caudoviricetes sp.]
MLKFFIPTPHSNNIYPLELYHIILTLETNFNIII